MDGLEPVVREELRQLQRAFIDYPTFEGGYEALKRATGDFRRLDSGPFLKVVQETAIALIVLRTMLGFTPPE
jgi:hypothetical protein